MVQVYVHGGVSGKPKPQQPSLDDVVTAARAFEDAVDAVEAAVCALEDDPALNAGYGAVLNLEGHVELDAGIADGARGRCGSVAGVAVRHPISLARFVMERTPHVFMAGPGAILIGRHEHFEELASSTPEQHQRWRLAMSGEPAGDYGRADQVDTVGAVALADDGNLSAGSSTGGVAGQMGGRVGDAPVFGAGFYASGAAAVVGTGLGELFIETLACARVGALLEAGLSPRDACEKVLERLAAARAAPAGLLALDSEGRVGAAYRGASWAVAGPNGPLDARCVGPAES